MVQICEGTKSKQDMLAESIEQYKDMYIRARGEFNKVVSVSSGVGTLTDIRY
jgi:DNA topoisomerase-3